MLGEVAYTVASERGYARRRWHFCNIAAFTRGGGLPHQQADRYGGFFLKSKLAAFFRIVYATIDRICVLLAKHASLLGRSPRLACHYHDGGIYYITADSGRLVSIFNTSGSHNI